MLRASFLSFLIASPIAMSSVHCVMVVMTMTKPISAHYGKRDLLVRTVR